MPDRPNLYLIDGSSQMYRAFHAPIRTLEGTLLRNSLGLPTNAVYIFVTMLRKLLKEQAPEYIAASFDLPGRTFRDDLAADYKANRRPMPDELAAQIPLVHRACEALGVPIVTQERFEADDVIGTIAERAAAEGYLVTIVTGDKDFFQLVGDGIRVFNPRDEGTWYDAAGVKEKFGVPPDQVVDALALMGDTIDNVKGVPGIGEKGARDLISTFATLDALLERAAEVPQKKYREALLAHGDEARHSRELLRIHTDVPVELDISAFKYRGPTREACYELFSELGFRSLVMEFAPDAGTTAKDYQLVTSAPELEALASELRRSGRFGLRVLADGPSAMRARIVGLSFAVSPRVGRYVPFLLGGDRQEPGAGGGLFDPAPVAKEGPPASVSEADAWKALRPILEDGSIEKAGHDLKFDSLVLARSGVDLAGIGVDTMLASYLLDSTRSGHPLEATALEHLGYKALSEEELCGKGAKAVPIADLTPTAVLTYAAERSDLPLQLAGRLAPLLAAEGLDAVYRTLERPLIPVLVAMERAGVRIDRAALAVQSGRLDTELSERSARIYALAGEPFNVNSPQQLSKILFEKLQLPAGRRNVKTKTASTAVEVLEELALSHDLPRLILEWRALQKLKGTYVDALPELINPATGRLHTSFNQAVAATGRLSSSDPNLQNIPIRTELGREIRRAFIADPGHVLISADYSQIELRVLAHLAGDETLIRAFQDGADIHDQTALKVFGPDSLLDPHELRRRAKIVNYALLYGKTAFTLAKDIGVSPQAAQEFIDAYFAGFPRVRAYIDRTIAEGRATGVVKTMYGRRRLVPDLTSPNVQIRSAAERAAVNLPIQGTAADIMKNAMIDVHAALGSSPTRMILTVHDELLFEVPKDRSRDVAEIVRDRMQHAASLNVPLVVDVGIGENWRDAKH
ncbi:MAG: DNA polymerase I [Acidobacteria bacterium RIFCSPLOWO2_02_FULL_65_29]|nr:MAG: DNA polymerase I [Acidobacteria bacterium RIFCSPLOWO2_02_FULL_65_29]